jgi:hypothetical protein
MKIAAAAMLLAVSLVGVAGPATAHADCGDPGQDPCTGPVPTVDQVVAVLNELTDPDIPAVNKTDIVTPGFAPEEAGTIDDHLNRMRGPALPLHFVVTNIHRDVLVLAGRSPLNGCSLVATTDELDQALRYREGHNSGGADRRCWHGCACWRNTDRRARAAGSPNCENNVPQCTDKLGHIALRAVCGGDATLGSAQPSGATGCRHPLQESPSNGQPL